MATHGYNVYYRAVGQGEDDWVYVGRVDPGTAELAVAHAASETWQWGISAVSAAGVEGDKLIRTIERLADGTTIYGHPNPIMSASAKPAVDGAIEITAAYSADRQTAIATTLQIAEKVAGVFDWDNPVATATLGLKITSKILTTVKTWSTGTSVELAVRAITATGIAGDEYELPAVITDATPPTAIDPIFIFAENLDQ